MNQSELKKITYLEGVLRDLLNLQRTDGIRSVSCRDKSIQAWLMVRKILRESEANEPTNWVL